MDTKSNNRKAVVLLSGGLDSTTCLAIAGNEGYRCYSLAFSYGQRHQTELDMAAWQARRFGVIEHKVVNVDLAILGGSALTGHAQVPKEDPGASIPITYVPARNAVFLSIGLAWAESLGIVDLFIGVNELDFSGYPDCRTDFIQAFENMANLATRAGTQGRRFKLHTPLIHLTKSKIIQMGLKLGVDYAKTHSCYDPNHNGIACGLCPSCRLRKKGFAEAGLMDPIRYQE